MKSFWILAVIALIVVFGAVLIAMNLPSQGKDFVKEEKEVSFTTLNQGYYNDLTSKQQRVVKTTEAWSDLWNEMFPTQIITPVPLEDEMIIAVFMGERGTGGYSITIEKIVDSSNSLKVFVVETSPGRGCGVTQAFTQPYHIVQLKRNEKRVEFILEQEVRDC